MIKFQNNILSRENLPSFLSGLSSESLIDLTWTDAALGLHGVQYFDEAYLEPDFNPSTQKLGEETFERVGDLVRVSHLVEILNSEELAVIAAKIQATIVEATQARLDDFAKARAYDGILSACTYATSSVPEFLREGQDAVNARDATWAALYTIMGKVQAGELPMPSGFADVEPLLPVLEWTP